MYVKKIDLLIFGFPSLFSFVFCPAAGWRSPSTLLLCTASILEVWSLNPQILKPQILKPQPSKFEASILKILKPQASTVKFWSLKPQSWTFWSLKPQILKPQASTLKFWSFKRGAPSRNHRVTVWSRATGGCCVSWPEPFEGSGTRRKVGFVTMALVWENVWCSWIAFKVPRYQGWMVKVPRGGFLGDQKKTIWASWKQ